MSFEYLPLLQSGNHSPEIDSSIDSKNSIFPPIGNSSKGSNASYGVIQVPPTPRDLDTKERRFFQSGGIASSPIVAIIAIVVGLVLILTVTTMTGGGSGVHLEPSSSFVRGNLKAAAPDYPSLSQSSTGYVDIDVSQGRLRGYKRLSRQKKEYTAFYKVPYAEPPLGMLRFKDPVAPSKWHSLRDIPVVAPQCIQKEKYSLSPIPKAVGEEDCLYANIYTPRLPQTGDHSSKLLPVMVYIHGGGLSGNGSRYGADYFMDEDVIIITFQFRIGIFGLLNTGDKTIRGNMAFKDMIQMLKWTKENIKYFGGNSDSLTVFGNSNGAFNVGHLMVSPMAAPNGKPLFNAAISQSGSSLCACATIPGNISEIAAKTVQAVSNVLGCDSRDSETFLKCLRTKDASELALVLTEEDIYSLTIEDREDDESTKFMPEHPYKLLESGRMNAVPYIIGNTNAEWYTDAIIILNNETFTNELNERFEDFSYLLNADLNKDEMAKVKQFYFGEEKIFNGSLKNFGNLISDRVMDHCSYTSARFHAMQADTYMYWITKPPYLSYVDKQYPGFPAKELGMVFHADELQYLFLYDGYPEIRVGDQEYYEFSKYFVKLWVNFARTRNGTMNGVYWEPVNTFGSGDALTTNWLEISDSPRMVIGPQRRMKFWDGFSHSQLRYGA